MPTLCPEDAGVGIQNQESKLMCALGCQKKQFRINGLALSGVLNRHSDGAEIKSDCKFGTS
jgi:hypothetical protein